MRWISGLVGAALATCLVARAEAIEPGPAMGAFEGRDYLLVWPNKTPSRVLVYFHASGPQAFGYESRSGVLEALAADANKRGYAVIAPAARKVNCVVQGAAPTADLACWRTDQANDEIAYIERLVSYVERTGGVTFVRRDAIGYELGSQLLLAAFANHGLDGFGRVGLVNVQPLDTKPSARRTGPMLYVEAPAGDPAAERNAHELVNALSEAGYGGNVCARREPGDHLYDGPQITSFLNWFDINCLADTQTAAPAGPGAAPTPVAVEGEFTLPGEVTPAEAARRRPRGG